MEPVTRGSSLVSGNEELQGISLHKLVDEKILSKMHHAFLEAEGNMNRYALRKTLLEFIGVRYTDDNYETLFLKININRFFLKNFIFFRISLYIFIYIFVASIIFLWL